MKTLARVLAFGIVLACFPAAAPAGTTGILRGTVTDRSTGKPIAAATVYAMSPAQDEKTKSDASGRYEFMDLIPGRYTVTVDAQGYTPIVVSGVTVAADWTVVANVQAGRRPAAIACVDCIVRWLWRSGWRAPDLYLIGAGRTSVTQTVPYSAASALRFIPGITAGPGQLVPQR